MFNKLTFKFKKKNYKNKKSNNIYINSNYFY